MFQIVEIEKPECNYIILENICREKRVSKGLYVILSNSQEPCKLGRGHHSDIRISDISVSRLHAQITYNDEQKQFYIFDNNSKFGTLIKLQKEFIITKEKVAFQIGRTVLTCVLKSQDGHHVKQNKLPKIPLALGNSSGKKQGETSNPQQQCTFMIDPTHQNATHYGT